jgi:hypothetical protein
MSFFPSSSELRQYLILTNFSAEWFALLLHILDDLGSDLELETGNPD